MKIKISEKKVKQLGASTKLSREEAARLNYSEKNESSDVVVPSHLVCFLFLFLFSFSFFLFLFFFLFSFFFFLFSFFFSFLFSFIFFFFSFFLFSFFFFLFSFFFFLFSLVFYFSCQIQIDRPKSLGSHQAKKRGAVPIRRFGL